MSFHKRLLWKLPGLVLEEDERDEREYVADDAQHAAHEEHDAAHPELEPVQVREWDVKHDSTTEYPIKVFEMYIKKLRRTIVIFSTSSDVQWYQPVEDVLAVLDQVVAGQLAVVAAAVG